MDKNIKKINEILNNWFYENEFDVTVFNGTDFAYYYEDDTIEYSFITVAKSDKVFMQTCRELGLIDDFNIFLISLFHEVGHYMTLDDIDDTVYAKCCKAKEKLETKEVYTEKEIYTYQHLADEIIATKWAVNYLNNNENRVKMLWNTIAPYIKKYYESIAAR